MDRPIQQYVLPLGAVWLREVFTWTHKGTKHTRNDVPVLQWPSSDTGFGFGHYTSTELALLVNARLGDCLRKVIVVLLKKNATEEQIMQAQLGWRPGQIKVKMKTKKAKAQVLGLLVDELSVNNL